jgi:hypothetical protein
MHSEQRQALPAQAILTLHKQPATQLRVISGCVWLTESHNPHDYFLQPGDAVHLQSDRTVVEALKDSVIAFMPPSAAIAHASLKKLATPRWLLWRHPMAARSLDRSAPI